MAEYELASITVRLSPSLKAQVIEAMGIERRSMTNFVVVALEDRVHLAKRMDSLKLLEEMPTECERTAPIGPACGECWTCRVNALLGRKWSPLRRG